MSQYFLKLVKARITEVTGPTPSNTVLPSIGSTAQVGVALVVVPGTWVNDTSRSYAWFANGAQIDGAAGTSFTPTLSEVGKTITVRERATNAYGSATVFSSPTTAVTNPITPNTAYFGDKTRQGHGGYDVGVGTTITSGNTGSVWTVDGNGHLVIAGTYGAAAPTMSYPYTLGLSTGATLSVQSVANAYTVRPYSTDSSSTNQINAVLNTNTVSFGDTIILRDGTTFGLGSSGTLESAPTPIGVVLGAGINFTQRSGGPSAPTDLGWSAPNYVGATHQQAGWVTIQPETPYGATMTNIYFDCKFKKDQYIRLKNINFRNYNIAGTAGSTTAAIVIKSDSNTSAWGWFAVVECDIRSRMESGAAASNKISSGIYLKQAGVSNNFYIIDNGIYNTYNGIIRSGDDYEITGNVIRFCYNDCVKGVATRGLVSWNLLADKTFIGLAHGDYFQEQWGPVGPGTYVGTTYIGNIMMIGDNGNLVTPGGGTQPGGQGIFIADGSDGVTITGVVAKGNVYVDGMNRAIQITACSDAEVDHNVIVQDQYATYPSNNPKIYFSGSVGGRAHNNVVYNGSTTGATTITVDSPRSPMTQDVGNYMVKPSDYSAAFNSPIFGPGMTETQMRQAFTSKVGGPLDSTPDKGIGVGTTYIDYVNRTTNFPVY